MVKVLEKKWEEASPIPLSATEAHFEPTTPSWPNLLPRIIGFGKIGALYMLMRKKSNI